MGEDKSKLNEFARNAVIETLKKVIEKKPKLISQKEIREETEAQIILQLVSIKAISDEDIQYVMQVFDKLFAEAYKDISETKLEEQTQVEDREF